jgi:hypothetical protein
MQIIFWVLLFLNFVILKKVNQKTLKNFNELSNYFIIHNKKIKISIKVNN